MSEVRPLAIAVIRHRSGGDEIAHRQALTAVETYADLEGYAVTEVVQGFGRSRIDPADVDMVLDLAERVDARAVLSFGDIDEQILHSIAVRSTLRVLPVPQRLLPVPAAHALASSPRTSTTPACVQTSALGQATSPAGVTIAGTLPARRIERAAPVWTGRLELELFNERGWRVGVIDVVVRIDSVTLWSQNRTLAVMDRDRFRDWLTQRPGLPFSVDDVSWAVRESVTSITVDGSIAYVIATEIVNRLLEVI